MSVISVTHGVLMAGLLGIAGICSAEPPALPQPVPVVEEIHSSFFERDTLSGRWFGVGEKLEEKGISVGLGVTQVYQINTLGGLSTHRQSGRYAGSYDLEVNLDLGRVAKLVGGRVYAHAEGSWSEGIDPPSVGSVFGVNADAGGNEAIALTELYYEQALLNGKLFLRVGKLDLSGGFECRGCPVSFDGNSFANDETTQFLNGALTNNPTIPFPEPGLGAVVHWAIQDWWYVSAGGADAQADASESGFKTTFDGDGRFFSIFEAGITPVISTSRGPLQGAYRVGVWYEPHEKGRFDGSTKRNDRGFYVSVDQMVWRESSQVDDAQGLGLFARFGIADEDVNPVWLFWSVGAQYRGLIPSRDNDVIAIGFAQGQLSKGTGFSEPNESVLELYYNAVVTPWVGISPMIQYVIHPGGDKSVNDALVLGFRVQATF